MIVAIPLIPRRIAARTCMLQSLNLRIPLSTSDHDPHWLEFRGLNGIREFDCNKAACRDDAADAPIAAAGRLSAPRRRARIGEFLSSPLLARRAEAPVDGPG